MKFNQCVFKILKKQNVKDARTDGQQREQQTPLKHRFGGEYNMSVHQKKITRGFTLNSEGISMMISCTCTVFFNIFSGHQIHLYPL